MTALISTIQLFFAAIFLLHGAESILQGAPVLENNYPFMVLIRKDFSESHMDLCSGIIINKEWILTIASCIYVSFMNNPTAATVMLGNNNQQLQSKHSLRRVIAHPNYELESFPKHNLALLQLETPLVFSDTVKSIEMFTGEIEDNSRCSVSGWGFLSMASPVFVDDLHYDNMTVLTQCQCEGSWSPYITLHGGNLCTTYEQGRGLTYGDLGGALVMQGKLIGVAAFADVEKQGQFPDIYWRIQYYSNWITTTIADN